MTRTSRPRKTANLSESVQRRLNMYALAASATGVSLLALAQPSEARIVYTHAHKVIGPNSQFGLDLNHDGIIDFTIHNYYRFATSYVWARLWATCPGTSGIEAASHFPESAYALSRGAKIGPPKEFEGRRVPMYSTNDGGSPDGMWAGATNRYLGVQFQDRHGRTHYGWARLTVRGGTFFTRIVAILTGYAYETIPNRPIIAGRTKGEADPPASDPVVPNSANPDDLGPGAVLGSPIPDQPQPATLGALATGALGLPIWRRKKI